jgi:branched-chain amino acid aminotransferase
VICEPRSGHVAWLDGEFVPWSAATMHVSDHHYGVGVFEGVRAYATGSGSGASIFRLDDHTARLLRSAHILKISIPERFDREQLNRAQIELLRRNQLRDAYLRPFVFHAGTPGLSPRTRGLSVRVAIMALEWRDDGAFAHAEGPGRGITLRTATFTRNHANSLFAKAKANGNYMNAILAREEARETGADDALLLDREGFVIEASAANVFIVRAGTLFTPPIEAALEGITRDTVIALAGMRGWNVLERRMTRDELYVADEVFLTGTAAELTPVREVDGRKIGAGGCGTVTAQLRSMYADLVRGRSDQRRDWITSI